MLVVVGPREITVGCTGHPLDHKSTVCPLDRFLSVSQVSSLNSYPACFHTLIVRSKTVIWPEVLALSLSMSEVHNRLKPEDVIISPVTEDDLTAIVSMA
jgi:hypothetical protein